MTKTNWSLLAAARFVLALIVAGGHITWINRDAISTTFDWIGPKAAVVGFLLISGYSIAAALDRDEASFYFRRFKRIYPVYLFSIIAAIALEMWLGRYSLPNYTFEPTGSIAAVGNLLLLQTFLVKPIVYNGVVWSLAVEVSYYVVSPYLKKHSVLVFGVLIAVSAIFFILPREINGGLLYEYALKMNVAKYFWPFAVGFLLHRNKSTAQAAVLAVATLTLMKLFNDGGSWISMPVIFSYATILLARANIGAHSRFFEYLGDISYPLYLVQIPVYVLAFKVWGITNTLGLLMLAILSSCLVYEIVDRRLKAVIFKTASNKSQGALNAANPL